MNRAQNVYFLFVSISLLVTSLFGQNTTSVASVYGEKWYAGDKLLVMQIAESRLLINPSDLASQLVLYDYAMSFMDTDSLEILIPMIRSTAANLKSPNFLQKKQLLDLSLESLEAFLPSVTEQMRVSEAYKGALPHKPLSVLPIIEALETDGLVARLSNEEKTLLATKAISHVPDHAIAGNIQQLQSTPLIELRKAFPSPRLLTGQNNSEPTSAAAWSIIVVLFVAATGLLWLLVKKRK